MKSRVFIMFLLLSCCVVHAANTKFYSVNGMYGIFLREAASICSDKSGFVWASSKTGILRLTDDDYRLYHLPYERAGFISVKLVYKNQALYAYTNNGEVFLYNSLKDKFEPFVNFAKLLQNEYMNIHALQIDDQGTFWMASSFGLYRYKNGKVSLCSNKNEDILSITWFDASHLIIGTSRGLTMCDTKNLKRTFFFRNTSILPFAISRLYYDKPQKRLWIGTLSNGLYVYDFDSKLFERAPVNDFIKQPVLAIEANSDSTLLLGIDGQGIWSIDRKTASHVLAVYKEDADDAFSLHGDGVYDIFCDANKRVWIGTYTGGVSFFDQKKPSVTLITHYVNKSNSLGNNYINQILEDRSGNIWFATNNGISKWNVKQEQWTTFYHNVREQAQVFLSLCEDDKGRIWAGTYASGVYVLDAKSGREIAHYRRPSISDFVFDVFKDSQGDLWIGSTEGSVKCYDVKTNRFRSYNSQPVFRFVEQSPGKILLACTYGLCLLDKQSGAIRVLLGGCVVQDVLVLNGRAWLCTRGDGLIAYDLKSGKSERFTTKTGLPSNYVNGIVCVGGNFWIGTESGLCKFNPKTYQVSTYSSLLSLSHVSFNPATECKLKNGNLLWGTNNGAILFDPAVIQDVKVRGSIYFQDLTVSGRSIKDNPTIQLKTPLDRLQKLSLHYNQNTLTLELLPLGMNASDSKFSWKMEGLDAEWTQPVNRRLITYTNLPGGNYVLKVRLYDSSMSHIIAERSIALHITPPVWRSWWFISLLIIVLGGIVYFLLRYYINRIKQLHVEEKVKFFANTAHDIRTSLTLINAPIEELRKERTISDVGKYYLQLVTQQSMRLSMVVTQLMDFQKVDIGKERLSLRMVDIVRLVSLQKNMFESFAGSKNIDIVFTADRASFMSAIDETMIEKVIGNLISNAIKYSHKDSQIKMNLVCDTIHWMLEVADQGIGISRRAQNQLFKEFYRADNAINTKIIGSGMGLSLAKSYVLMHGGKISCESQENEGSVFRVDIPYKEIFDPYLSNETHDDALELAVAYPDAGPGENHPRDLKVIVVEDNDDLRTFMKFSLGEDFEVTTAEDGAVAWDLICRELPDLVVSDVMMPNMDGFELCRLMKSTYETSHIPIILLTALSEKAEQLHGLGLGADDYLTKPFDITLLLERIKSIIYNRESVREKALRLINKGSGLTESILINENNDVFVKKALAVVSENIGMQDFGKEEFASAMNVSSSLLYKKLKALTGLSPVDFIKSIRLNHAVSLLKSRKYMVTEVSELCGFASVGYFSTVFRKYFGKSPTDLLNEE